MLKIKNILHSNIFYLKKIWNFYYHLITFIIKNNIYIYMEAYMVRGREERERETKDEKWKISVLTTEDRASLNS